ncbi:sigma-54 interaction domain-containing protein [Clostridium sp. Cult2]|uniref:sigma-54 interaction domain-containing protein n=1 Tax=Clostridium sp. Cult2 TaxID=2079003 RepID=UPI001F02BA11|nr:sigma 54-interacting transcriptional regulator [Clostridium sp. Cult2]MCF6465768.1 sigma-54-dependent Fis family transcriptional regulator [Clostridium sp. Cult2]
MLFNSEEYVKMFTDMMSEGFIVIDSNGKIQIYNNKAKEIFGIVYNQQISHDHGKLNKGDIVIIGDNSLGRDDGNLNSKSLECLGIEDENIGEGDGILAIGVFQEKGVPPIYKYLKSDNMEDTLKLKTNYLGLDLGAIIDFVNKIITIEIDDEKYSMGYINAIGHMVILDGKTKKMKFYQAQGYTARGESINDLFKGYEYRSKGENSNILNAIGKDIFEIHKGSSTIKELYKVAKGENIRYIDEFKEINGIPTMCTFIPVDKDGVRIGAALKVEDISEIKLIIRERDKALLDLEKIERELEEGKIFEKAFPDIIGESKEINHVKRLALKATRTNSTVLILGESGTGKTILAKAIHEKSRFKDKPFIHVNCGAIPTTLLESELFGYEKGAFTGARKEGKIGFFELANGGTIFLDELGEIPLNLQVKLLQVLQEKSFYRVGGTDKIDVSLRIIAATNKNLEEEILEGRFREDLYYRINVFPIWIPPLRERIEDIYALVDILLPKICKEIGIETKRISAEALNLLTRYNWPGNVRELENILERAVNLSENSTILSKHITLDLKEEKSNIKNIISLKESVSICEKNTIKRALNFYEGNKKKAMEALGISKTSFYEKLKRYDID